MEPKAFVAATSSSFVTSSLIGVIDTRIVGVVRGTTGELDGLDEMLFGCGSRAESCEVQRHGAMDRQQRVTDRFFDLLDGIGHGQQIAAAYVIRDGCSNLRRIRITRKRITPL